MVTCWEVCLWLWPTRKSLEMCGPLGKILLFLYGSLENLCWFYSQGGPILLYGEISSQLTRELPLCLGPARESIHDTIFTGDLVDDLNSWGSFLGNFWFPEGCFWYSPFFGDALGVFVSFTQLRVFLSFWCILEFSFPFSTFREPTRDICSLFFFNTKLHVV